ncbi:hypothetical protein NMY22_g12730 [Coprinellus aureogranulatus]|nr:hypothetical protein NMY22_g12730 [Coprinellus aureogranulatus]
MYSPNTQTYEYANYHTLRPSSPHCSWYSSRPSLVVSLTDIAATSEGIVQGLAQYETEFLAHKIMIFICRVGPILAAATTQVKTSIFVEQTANTKPKVTSGTLGVIYPLPDASLENMRLQPIVEARRNAPHLKMSDIRASSDSVKAYRRQSAVNVVKILLENVADFNQYAGSPLLQNVQRRPKKPNHRNDYFPLRVAPIEEATVKGNFSVQQDFYVNQMGRNPEELSEFAIPSCNDQLTNSRIRSGQITRKHDIGGWNSRLVFELGLALFHLIMNLIWAVRETHYGTIHELGSLAHLFLLLGKTRLGNPKPDFHSLLAALQQVLGGVVILAWEKECGFDDLKSFADSKPTPEQLIEIAYRIVEKYATPTPSFPASYTPKSSKGGVPEPSASSESAPDLVKECLARLLRDLLLVIELVSAVKDGDFGRIEDILPDLAFLFRGAGSNNYSTEILHILHSFKYVWTPAFADIMRNIMLINVSGLPGHFMGLDLNIEYLIGYLKALFLAKGYYANWDRCGNISASIGNLMVLKRQVSKSLQLRYQGKTHSKANTTVLVMKIASKAKELRFLDTVPGRSDTKLKPDLRSLGYTRIESSSLAAFNTKLDDMKSGRASVNDPRSLEEDELAPANFSDPSDSPSMAETIDKL